MLHRSLLLGVVIAMAAGCSSDQGVSDPDQEEELAATLEGLSRDATTEGDPDASAAFSGAAMAVRLGIRPTPIPVSIDGETRRYLAFVHLLNHNRGGVTLTLRTLVAFEGGNARPAGVLYVALPSDSADFAHPANLRPAASGSSSWKDLAARQFYLAIRGYGIIKPQSREGDCPKVSARASVKCTVAKFGVVVKGGYHALTRNQRGAVDDDRSVVIQTRADGVNGAILTVN
jgi:hypothetical protein